MTGNFIDRREVANLLGISYSSVKAFITKYELPYYKFGARTFYREDEIARYIQKNKYNSINKPKEAIN